LPDLICDTSVVQYLHQLRLLHLLPKLADRVIVPPAVTKELDAGRTLGVDVPDPYDLQWLCIKQPVSIAAIPLINDLGPGETEVLMLALELQNAVAVLDDRLARQIAENLNLRYTGTLGILLDAKQASYITDVASLLNKLEALHFRVSSDTREAVLRLAGESR
jgi:uncharacterized protein